MIQQSLAKGTYWFPSGTHGLDKEGAFVPIPNVMVESAQRESKWLVQCKKWQVPLHLLMISFLDTYIPAMHVSSYC